VDPGDDVDLRPPTLWTRLPRWLYTPRTYHLTRFAILRLFGLVYFFAFLGVAHQVLPLLGSHGLTPVAPLLDHARAAAHARGHDVGFWQAPTIFWWNASDAALVGWAMVGLLLSALVMCGVANMPILGALWLVYGSYVRVGQDWFAFGWEIQILETGLLVMFLAPPLDWRPLPERPPPLTAIFLLRWLTFRIMLGAGLIKIRGDACWDLHHLSCLDWHFQTQPIPNPLSPLLHAAPHVVHAAGVLYNHLCELILPWAVFGPRIARHVAGACMLVFQVTLILSGNLSFLNWLTIVPILACFDDDLLRRLLPRRARAALARIPFARRPRTGHTVAVALFAVIVGVLSVSVVENLASSHQRMNASFDRFDLVNTYGAFGTVGDERDELIFEGTSDADPGHARWRPYELPCKPGDVARRPCVLGPYHERLDWLLWFAAMAHRPDPDGSGREIGEPYAYPWVVHLVWKLLHDDPGARSLLANDPFPDRPPTWIRVRIYRYRFAPITAHVWWERRLIGEWLEPVSVDDPWLRGFLRDHGWLPDDGSPGG